MFLVSIYITIRMTKERYRALWCRA